MKTSALPNVSVREHFQPDQRYSYSIGGTLFVPRWAYLLLRAENNPIKALDLLSKRHIEDVDRRLKEKNL